MRSRWQPLDSTNASDSNCTFTGCGNTIVTAGEECDDGNTVPGDCCSAICLSENSSPDCGDAAASVDEVWPPNHKMTSVGIVGVTDPDTAPTPPRLTPAPPSTVRHAASWAAAMFRS